jgi:hypothetical protein
MLYKATTEGDCEGRTTRLLGFFHANSKLQVVEHLVVNDIKPYYKYKVELVEARDIRNLKVDYVHSVIEDKYCNIQVKLKSEREDELQRRLIYSTAVNKLTEKEKEVLGIPVEHRGVDY